jgi:polyhydroxyalkanoate synthesis regulator phasin
MKLKKKTLVLGVAGALAVAGGGAAIGATQLSGDSGQPVINDAAQQLGVSPTALSDALKNAVKHQIDAAVAAGRLTKAQGDALKARIDAGRLPFGLGFGFGAFGHHGLGGPFGQLDAAATYLGLTEAQLRTQLSNGKTLAQIAKDQNKSVSGLVDAMTASAKKHLDAAVAAGRLTQAQADQVAKDLEQRITDLVNGKRPDFDRPSFRDVRPFGGFGEFHRFRGGTF